MIRKFTFVAAAFIFLGSGLSYYATAQSVTGTLKDSLSGDPNHNGIANPGDTITYKAVLKNPSGINATGVQYNNPTPNQGEVYNNE